ncbi:MAG: methionine adenosyltransferase domain-containing protein [Candidatus Saccharibacteria bacterium]|nr:methionine adenosyltransferase domain-containing protein [Candidatus Saccharibacteria bacterium]
MAKSTNISTNPLRNLSGFRTAESVSPRHPDKLCDRISDALLDAYLEQDKDSRVAIDIAGGHGEIFIAGEVTTTAKNVDAEKLAHKIAGDNLKVYVNIVQQSPEIARGVDTGGAGDQGIMIGFATDETKEMLPREVVLSRRLCQFIYEKYPYDGKTQVTLDGDKIDSVVASFQNVSEKDLRARVEEFFDGEEIRAYHINPAGDWNLGGFDADSGLTGRKLAVDNYGPSIPVGGGAFSGKDPSKVDRSAAYIARRIAVDYLRERKAHEVYVRLAYAIGFDQPLERTVVIDGDSEEIPSEKYDLSPRGIIKALDLKRPIYAKTAEWGHFGEGFSWDK